jgi:SnoaL-like domain
MNTVEDLARELEVLRHRVDAAEGVLQIQELKARYGELVDARCAGGSLVPPDELERLGRDIAALFTEDGVWDGGPALGRAVGREEIAARLATPSLDFSRHLFVKPRISVEGDSAAARWDLLCPCRLLDGRSYWMCGYEDDVYVRAGSGWLHRSMRLTTVFMAAPSAGWERILG